MVTHSSILAWKIPQTAETCGLYSPWGRKELNTTEQPSMRIKLKNESLLRVWLPDFSPNTTGISFHVLVYFYIFFKRLYIILLNDSTLLL